MAARPRLVAGLPAEAEPPLAWQAALAHLMGMPRPDESWDGPRGQRGRHREASSAYADDTHSGGWAFACLVKSLRRIAVARTRASLHADALKCKVLTSTAVKADLDALLEPLRRGNADHWQVVTSMRVLGVTLSDPTDRAELEQAIRATLRVRVVATTERLIAELQAGVDIVFAFINGKTITIDVRTTNTQCASAPSSADAHLRSQEQE